MQVFEEAQRNQLVTEVDIQTQVALDNYQVQLSDIANPTQSQDNVVIDRHGEFLPHWNESLDFDTWIKMSMEVAGKCGLVIHGNGGLMSVSNGDNIFELFDDFNDDSIDTSIWNISETPTESNGVITLTDAEILYSKTTFGVGYALRTRAIITTSSGTPWFGFRDQDITPVIEVISNLQTSGKLAGRCYETGASYTADLCNINEWHIFDIARLTDKGIFHIDDGLANEVTTQVTEDSLPVEYRAYSDNEIKGDWILIRKYVETEPTVQIGTPKNIAAVLKSLGRAG